MTFDRYFPEPRIRLAADLDAFLSAKREGRGRDQALGRRRPPAPGGIHPEGQDDPRRARLCSAHEMAGGRIGPAARPGRARPSSSSNRACSSTTTSWTGTPVAAARRPSTNSTPASRACPGTPGGGPLRDEPGHLCRRDRHLPRLRGPGRPARPAEKHGRGPEALRRRVRPRRPRPDARHRGRRGPPRPSRKATSWTSTGTRQRATPSPCRSPRAGSWPAARRSDPAGAPTSRRRPRAGVPDQGRRSRALRQRHDARQARGFRRPPGKKDPVLPASPRPGVRRRIGTAIEPSSAVRDASGTGHPTSSVTWPCASASARTSSRVMEQAGPAGRRSASAACPLPERHRAILQSLLGLQPYAQELGAFHRFARGVRYHLTNHP